MKRVRERKGWDLYSCGDHHHIKLTKAPDDVAPEVVREYSHGPPDTRTKEGERVRHDGQVFVVAIQYIGSYLALIRDGDTQDSKFCPVWEATHGKGLDEGIYHREDIKLYYKRECTLQSAPERQASGFYGCFDSNTQKSFGSYDSELPYRDDAFQPQPRMPETTFNNPYNPSFYPQEPEAYRDAFYNYGNHASSFVLQQPVASSDPTYASEVHTSSSRQREERSGAHSNRDSAHKSSKKSASVSKSKKSRPRTSHQKAR